MRQFVEFVTRTTKITERETAKGFIYSFAVKIETPDNGGESLTHWLQCAIYQHERRPELLQHSGEFHFTGELRVAPPWGDRPQELRLWGWEIEPVLGSVWRVRKSRSGARNDSYGWAADKEEDSLATDGQAAKRSYTKSETPKTKSDKEPPEFPEIEDETGGYVPF